MYKHIVLTSCSNIQADNNRFREMKRREILKRNIYKYKRLYVQRHNDYIQNEEVINLHNNYNLKVESWKHLSELCKTIYVMEKEVFINDYED